MKTSSWVNPCSSRRFFPAAWLVLRWLLAGCLSLSVAGAAAAQAGPAVEEPGARRGGFVFSLLPKSLQKNPRLDLNVITEMTPEGKKLPVPTAAQPAYYFTIPGGHLKVGQAPPANETSPPVAELEDVMKKALARTHYLPAEMPAHPPTLALVYHWGSHNNMAEDGQALADQMASGTSENSTLFVEGQLQYALTDLAKRRDLLERAAIVGGVKFSRELEEALNEQANYTNTVNAPVRAPGMGEVSGGPIMGDAARNFVDVASPFERFRRRNPQVEHLLEESFASCYFVIASAYDAREIAQGRRNLLWRTKMTVNADGVALRDTLPTLMITAGNYFGRDMEGAATISRRLLRSGEVEIGTPTVVEYPAAGAPAAPAKSR